MSRLARCFHAMPRKPLSRCPHPIVLGSRLHCGWPCKDVVDRAKCWVGRGDLGGLASV